MSKNRPSNKERTPGGKKLSSINSAKKHESPAVASGRFWTRDKVYLALGLAGGLTLAGVFAGEDCNKNPPSQTTIENREAGLNEITLGNVRFFFRDPGSINPEKKKIIIETVTRAYNRLTKTFGREIMTTPEHYDFPIVLGESFERATITWNIEAKLDANGLPEVTNKPIPVSLRVNDIAEDVLAHEFVHLFMQPPGAFWTEAFHEGHAYAIQNTLYPEKKDKSPDSIHSMVMFPAVQEEFQMGLDYNKFDQAKLRGGIQDPLIMRLASDQWATLWEEYGKANPDFFRLFYVEIARLKKQGKISFQKDELVEIAQKVNSGFMQWYNQKAPALHEIGSTPKNTSVRSIKDPANGLLYVFNFTAVPRRLSATNMTPPHLKPYFPGQMQVAYDDPISTAKQARAFSQASDGTLGVMKLPPAVIASPTLQVNIGGIKIP